MEEDGAMLMLLEWVERQLEEMDKDQETELRESDGTPITKETNDQLHRND